ncbi:MAG: ELWxxDGT repeat protein [Brevundimonas sp.]
MRLLARPARLLVAASLAVALALMGASGPAQAAQPKDVEPHRLTAAVANGSFTSQYTALGHRVVFQGFSSKDSSGSQPWITDGTPTGTHRIAVTTWHQHSTLTNLTGTGSKVFFTLVDDVLPDSPIQLWVTDGTAGGTRLLMSIKQRAPYPRINHLTAVGNRIFFNISVPNLSRHLWVSDGTVAGTKLVKAFPDDNHGFEGTGQTMVGLGGKLYFPAYDASHGTELWSSDGTAAGTKLVADVVPGPTSGDPLDLTSWKGRLLFSTPYLYVSDGTAAGTSQLKLGGQPITGPLPAKAPIGTKLFLYGWVGADHKMIVTDGTSAGTAAAALPASLQVTSTFAQAGGAVLFGARTISLNDDEELWRTDGTTAGTTRVKDLYPGLLGSTPRNLVSIGSRVFFDADLPGVGTRFVVSDGTAAGTRALAYRVGIPDTSVSATFVAGMVFFDGDDSVYKQPWVWEPGPTYLTWCALTVKASFRYASRPVATLTVGSSAPSAGKKVALYDGSKKLAGAVLAAGKATVKLPASLRVGKHTLKAVFPAQGNLKACSAAKVVTVAKALSTVKATVAHGKVTVKVTAKNVTPTGKVTVTVKKKGHALKTLTTTLKVGAKGKHVFVLPHLAKGSYTITTKYGGSATVTSGTAKTLSLRLQG